jgi:glycosyltransferase involved in cell wall biosynthesis
MASKVLLFSPIPVFTPTGMASGLGLRVWGLARALSARGHQVRIAEPVGGRSTAAATTAHPEIEWVSWGKDTRASRPLIEEADVVIVQPTIGQWPHFLRSRPRCLVVDLYNPTLIDCLTYLGTQPQQLHHYGNTLACHLFFLRRGDAFLCAGERQRRYYLGALSAAGRLNALADLDRLLQLVPMGTETEPPKALPERLLRGRWAAEDAELLLWPGGIYPWFDALTAVRALARVRRERPRASLLFVGAENPLAGGLSSPGAAEAAREAARLNLPEEAIRFAPWLPHAQRAAMYFEADLAVLAHKPLLEAEFSWRTRTLDCLWGGLPMVLTAGDELGERSAAAGAALCVPPGDDRAMAAEIATLLADPDSRAAMRRAARRLATEELSWNRVVEPLHSLCEDPRPAPDRDDPVLARLLGRTIAPRCPIDGPFRLWSYRAASSIRGRGVLGAVRRGLAELRPLARLAPGNADG